MRWIYLGVDDACGRWARRQVPLILTIAVTVTLVGCGNGTKVNNNAAGGSASGCPTQGVGGDTVAPACVPQPTGSSGGTTGVPGPATPSSTPTARISSTIGSQPIPSTGHGIAGPATSSPSRSPSLGIAGPATPSIAPSSNSTPVASPRVTAISPTSGTKAGGTSVTITGSGFSDATTVDFGGVSAVMTVDSDTKITATSPPGTGTVHVTVIPAAALPRPAPPTSSATSVERPARSRYRTVTIGSGDHRADRGKHVPVDRGSGLYGLGV